MRVRLDAAGIGVAVLATAAIAVTAGEALSGGDRIAVVLPLAVAAVLVVAVLAATRFTAYVLLMLGVRPLVDLFKLSGSSAGHAAGAADSRAIDPSTLVAILFLIAAALWLAARLHRDGRLRVSPLGWAMLLVGVTALISSAGAARPLTSVLEALRILTVVVMFVVVEQLATDADAARKILLACYASLIPVLAYTLVLSALGNPPSEVKGDFSRLTGVFTQSTTFGRYLMFLVVFGFGLYRFLDRRARGPLGVLLAICLVFVLLTNTRSAIIGTAIGLVVVAALHRSKGMLAMLVVVAVAAVALLPSLGARFAELGDQRAVGGAPTGNTLEWRLGYWTQIVGLADSNPVTGIGPDMTQQQTDEAKKPHNDFLRAYVETGLVGLVAYLAMLVGCLLTARLAVRRAPPGSVERGIAVGFAGCAVAFVAVSAVSNVISNVVTLWYFVAFAAVASAIARRLAPPVSSVAGGGDTHPYDAARSGRDVALAGGPPLASVSSLDSTAETTWRSSTI